MDIQLIAGILLALRVVAVIFLLFVILRQLKLLRETTTEHTAVRLVMLVLVGITFAGNFVPIAIDVATLLSEVERTTPSTLGVGYAFSNAITACVSAIGWFVLYRIIAIEQDAVKQERADLTQENVELTADNKAMHKAEDKRVNDAK